ncbi:hypothetical protein [Mangrovibacterium sp.]|uniref:HYC_CC_PP family protein n=1 Tax=Mangrovibacterium sp. TaxID=1961364 RepID=UPI00356271CE
MKKILSIHVAIIYLLLTIGSAVSLNYCCGEIASYELYAQAEPCCCDDGEEEAACCQNEVHVFQFDDQQGVTPASSIQFVPATLDLKLFASSFDQELNQERSLPAFDFFVPPLSDNPLWLLQCALVYYG